jgi:hypothetical protein
MDSRTIFIIVGDGRNNYNDPRQDLFSMLSKRSRRTIWLNPEAPSLWGTGDSDMLKYASHCTSIYQVSNLAELTAAVDKMLTNEQMLKRYAAVPAGACILLMGTCRIFYIPFQELDVMKYFEHR